VRGCGRCDVLFWHDQLKRCFPLPCVAKIYSSGSFFATMKLQNCNFIIIFRKKSGLFSDLRRIFQGLRLKSCRVRKIRIL
jgi:hypothetical protein